LAFITSRIQWNEWKTLHVSWLTDTAHQTNDKRIREIRTDLCWASKRPLNSAQWGKRSYSTKRSMWTSYYLS
jgi:hypothetical protein